MVRSSKIQVVAVLLAVALGAACTIEGPAGPTININNALTNTVTISFANPVESKLADCPAIGQIAVNRPDSLTVGATADFLVTPKDASGKDREARCDIADGLTTTVNPTDVLTVEDPNAFVTKVTGKKKGTAAVTVNVGAARATVNIPVL